MNTKSTLVTVTLLLIASLAVVSISDGTDAAGNTWYVQEPEANMNVAVSGQETGFGTAENPFQLDNVLWNRVADGDTLYVVGTYDSTMYIQKNVTIIGTDGSVLKKGASAGTYTGDTWNGDTWKGSERGLITFRDLSMTSQFSISGGNSYTFENCSFGFQDVTSDGNEITNVYIYTVDDLTFTDCTFNGSYSGSNQWITALQVMEGNGRANSITIDGCAFTGYLRGCDIQLTSNIMIRNNSFTLVDKQPSTNAIAMQIQDNLSGSRIVVENNDFVSESPSATFFSVHSSSTFVEDDEPSVSITNNSILRFDNVIVYRQAGDGTYCPVSIYANNNYFSTDGVDGTPIPANDESGSTVSGLVVCDFYYTTPDMDVTNEDIVRPPIIWDDDDDYVPPIVPAQPSDSGDDNTVTVVACAAAAVVAALMAAFLILDRKR